MPRLIVIKGIDSGKEVEIDDNPVSIGHSREREFFLQDDRVSRLHAVAERQEGRTVLRDMNSSNGTYVNDESISEIRLQHNDFIVMGDTHLKYIAEDEVFRDEKRRAVNSNDMPVARVGGDDTAILPGANGATCPNISIDDGLDDIVDNE